MTTWTITVLALMLVLASPIEAGADTLIDWSQDKDGGQKTYTVDGVRITLSAIKNSHDESPRLEVTSPGGTTTSIFGPEQHLAMSATVRVSHLDPAHSDIDVMFGAFTGGAHCCIAIKVLSLIGGSWRVADLGPWDGDGMPEPQEVSGRVALVFGDNEFLYAFAAYAMSATPLKILQVQNGEIVDVSTEADFKALHRQNMVESQKLCATRSNGACAAYVASAARLGLFAQAWNFMLTHYDRRSDWSLEFCDIPGKDKCAKSVAFDSFPNALDWFLHKHGYLAGLPPAPGRTSGAQQTTVLCGRPVEYLLDEAASSSPVLGVWIGNWSNRDRLCAGLIVQRVRTDGMAEIVYVYGAGRPGSKVPWQQQRRTALVSPQGSVSFQDDQGSTYVFNLESTGILSGKFIGRSGNLTGLFARPQP
jgi:hypothetical protein